MAKPTAKDVEERIEFIRYTIGAENRRLRALNDELVAEKETLKDLFSKANLSAVKTVERLRAEIDYRDRALIRMAAINDELVAAFKVYAYHTTDCSGGDGMRCACGYLDALAKAGEG